MLLKAMFTAAESVKVYWSLGICTTGPEQVLHYVQLSRLQYELLLTLVVDIQLNILLCIFGYAM